MSFCFLLTARCLGGGSVEYTPEKRYAGVKILFRPPLTGGDAGDAAKMKREVQPRPVNGEASASQAEAAAGPGRWMA